MPEQLEKKSTKKQTVGEKLIEKETQKFLENIIGPKDDYYRQLISEFIKAGYEETKQENKGQRKQRKELETISLPSDLVEKTKSGAISDDTAYRLFRKGIKIAEKERREKIFNVKNALIGIGVTSLLILGYNGINNANKKDYSNKVTPASTLTVNPEDVIPFLHIGTPTIAETTLEGKTTPQPTQKSTRPAESHGSIPDIKLGTTELRSITATLEGKQILTGSFLNRNLLLNYLAHLHTSDWPYIFAALNDNTNYIKDGGGTSLESRGIDSRNYEVIIPVDGVKFQNIFTIEPGHQESYTEGQNQQDQVLVLLNKEQIVKANNNKELGIEIIDALDRDDGLAVAKVNKKLNLADFDVEGVIFNTHGVNSWRVNLDSLLEILSSPNLSEKARTAMYNILQKLSTPLYTINSEREVTDSNDLFFYTSKPDLFETSETGSKMRTKKEINFTYDRLNKYKFYLVDKANFPQLFLLKGDILAPFHSGVIKLCSTEKKSN